MDEWDCFFAKAYGNFGDIGKATPKSPPDNLTRWIITQSKSFYGKRN